MLGKNFATYRNQTINNIVDNVEVGCDVIAVGEWKGYAVIAYSANSKEWSVAGRDEVHS